MEKETPKLILGLKVRLARQEKGLTLQQLAERSGITLSYLHDIENGKKYPSPQKITALAPVLGMDYDMLVSMRGLKKLDPIVDLLESDFFQTYPLGMFGLHPGKVIEILAGAPEKFSAFVSTILKITRSYDLTRESLNLVALRSYQDMNNNYFADIEAAAQQLRNAQGWPGSVRALTTAQLEQVLAEQYGIRVERESLAADRQLQGIRSFFSPHKRVLYLNRRLSTAQENFLLARELGFQHLGIHDNRPYETIILQAENFEKLLHNFQASYFASALLMDEKSLTAAVRACAALPTWQPTAWLALLEQYDVTAEMLLQRLTNILPAHFGIRDLFFIRMEGNQNLKTFDMTKELHLSGQQSPYAAAHGIHYCRRWISIDILRRLRVAGAGQLQAAAQLSEYWQTNNQYLCISMAKPNHRDPRLGVSVTIGLLHSPALRQVFRFLNDPDLPRMVVHTHCETCSIPDCMARAAPPVAVEAAGQLLLVQERLQLLER